MLGKMVGEGLPANWGTVDWDLRKSQFIRGQARSYKLFV